MTVLVPSSQNVLYISINVLKTNLVPNYTGDQVIDMVVWHIINVLNYFANAMSQVNSPLQGLKLIYRSLLINGGSKNISMNVIDAYWHGK